ncbi:putative DsbA family dithiol-disulfide isomerase [Deinococcus metalli]|uniref:DSBA oxidoreductase n=1 Tax=Deinococcus metalli TaxID=1141878 RepID=A0A7W8KKT6_9DEIO|nr:DsbA family oxidoreductase [Deinococcus metalli]MBB5378826.1 putative DsbA family dithiol-disulfide isomerase [Deinococcus metalli]GHF61980.1 DSBA oxidoreductase [Deinococcus metalli]
MTALTPTSPDKLRVDIWSDVACPWCYIGKRRLESALADFPQATQVEVVWHAFELDPQAPLDAPQSMVRVLAGKYGRSEAEAQGMIDQVTATAAGDGLAYDLNGAQRTNTFLAHQLIHLAAEHGVQGAMNERLLSAHLSEGEHVGQIGTLVRLAQEVGLDGDEVRASLEAGTHAAAVRQDEAQARALGIGGVPFFVLGGKYGVSGAQGADVLRGALEQVWAETHPAPLVRLDTPAAASCEDGACEVPTPTTR